LTSNRAERSRVAELVQNDKVAAGAALIREIVTSRVNLPHAMTTRTVLLVSTNVASLPPVTVL